MMSFKDYLLVENKTTLLEEGGVAGHMAHLYDNRDLTFNELKDILAKASNGELVGTEKTDGQNLFITYSIKDGRAKAARNKGNIKQGGMTAEQLAKKFEGRGNLKKAFVDAFKTFEKAVRGLSPEQQVKIFGEDGDIYYNAEIMDPRTANVINYDKKTLLIHQVGHAYFDKQTGTTKDVDVSTNAKALDNAIAIMQDAITGEDFAIAKNAVRNLEALDDDTALKQALANIEKLENVYGLSDNNTIGDYLKMRLQSYLQQKIPDLPVGIQHQVVKRIMGEKGMNVTSIIKNLDPIQKNTIKIIVRAAPDLIKQFIYPLEDIIHDFTVAMLANLKSMFVLDNRKETKRLRGEVERAIQAIERSNSEVAHEVLKKQLQKIKKSENINTAVEGFVFDYNGQTYKFTGNFAPANQLLGLFKYGRAGVNPEEFQNEI